MSAPNPDNLSTNYVVYSLYSYGHPQMISSFCFPEKAVGCVLEQRIPEGYAQIDPPKTQKQLLEELDKYVGFHIKFRDMYNSNDFTLYVDQVEYDDSEPTAGTALAE